VDIEATKNCFWELYNRGVVTISGNIKPNAGSDESVHVMVVSSMKERLESYCKENGISKIPVGAKAEAIMYFQFKCKQVPEDASVDEEFAFLKNYLKLNESNVLKQTISKHQEEFLLSIKKDIISDHKDASFFNDEKNPTIKEKILQLEVISLLKANKSKQFRDLVIQLYYYYLAKYEEFLPDDRKPSMTYGGGADDFSDYSEKAKNSYEEIEKLREKFSVSLGESSTGNLPELIYHHVDDCSKILLILKSEIGTSDKLYQKSSSKVVRFSTNMIAQWIKMSPADILNVQIQGMKVGKTLLEVCNNTLLKIGQIETDEKTTAWFKSNMESFGKLTGNTQSNSGCFIATMAYGDYNHPQVLVLREFRDNYLLKTIAGEMLVNFYYWLSPKIVSRFGDNKSFKKRIRNLLDKGIDTFQD